MAVLPLHHSGNGEEVTTVDNFLALVITVGGNVIAHFIIEWIKDLLHSDRHDNER